MSLLEFEQRLKKVEEKMNDAELLMRFMCSIPTEEADALIGSSIAETTEFLGIQPEEYEYSKHYYLALAKAKRIIAQAMVEEYNKGITC